MSELIEDDLITREEVATMFEALPKAKGRGSSSSAPAVDTKGFVEFARKVLTDLLLLLVVHPPFMPAVVCSSLEKIRTPPKAALVLSYLQLKA